MATIEELKILFSGREPHEIAIEIHGFTGFRTTLIEELTQEEIDKLFTIKAKKIIEQTPKPILEDLLKKEWKCRILLIATEQGIKHPDGWEQFNHWMLNNSVFKKHLNAHTLDELQQLHRQLCKLRDNNIKTLQKHLAKEIERINLN